MSQSARPLWSVAWPRPALPWEQVGAGLARRRPSAQEQLLSLKCAAQISRVHSVRELRLGFVGLVEVKRTLFPGLRASGRGGAAVPSVARPPRCWKQGVRARRKRSPAPSGGCTRLLFRFCSGLRAADCTCARRPGFWTGAESGQSELVSLRWGEARQVSPPQVRSVSHLRSYLWGRLFIQLFIIHRTV